MTLSGPQSAKIRSMLQNLKPLPVTILKPAISWRTHSQNSITDTFNACEFLKEFDILQPVDIVAQAMELSLIPRDSNNNNDILSQAMDIADIS